MSNGGGWDGVSWRAQSDLPADDWESGRMRPGAPQPICDMRPRAFAMKEQDKS